MGNTGLEEEGQRAGGEAIDDLIERLRAFAALPLPPENIEDQNMCREAADALASLKAAWPVDLDRDALERENAKLREALEAASADMFRYATDETPARRLVSAKIARAALGEKP